MTTMTMGETEASELVAFRHRLHTMPDVSGKEGPTAAEVRRFLEETGEGAGPDRVVSGLGGHGLAFVYEGAEPGPTVMIRCELDGLPIAELSDLAYRSGNPGQGHMCGHDGHMAIVAGLGRMLMRRRPQRGRAVLLFQPAEEDGTGAAAVIADPRFAGIAPDYAFALHNFPGLPLGTAALKAGPAACASRGMRIVLSGRTAHASMPDTGVSPMAAISRLMPALTALGSGGALSDDFRLVTVTHAAMGAPAFGIAPGHGEIWATLRTMRDASMAALVECAEALVREAAEAGGLGFEMSYHDVFAACENDGEATAILRRALDAAGVAHAEGEPMRASEDFGRFGAVAATALMFLGAGGGHANLHNPDYDFPDALIPIGASVFAAVLDELLG